MNKVININFQGRVIPIEEPAYDELKKYIDSLRSYFANEDGKEEIVNDIENRIAELFSEKLKAGQSFISEAHVAAIIASMGRPEQFDEISFEAQTEILIRLLKNNFLDISISILKYLLSLSQLLCCYFVFWWDFCQSHQYKHP